MNFWWQSLIKPKKKPEQDLQTLVEGLRAVLGQRLKSVVVFGSMASGEFHPDHSDVNVLVVTDVSYQALEQMTPALSKWLKKGHTPPILAAIEDLPGMTRSFPIEFLDMLDHHRVAFGEDPFGQLSVDNRHLRAQIEHDLALARLKLRQSITAAGHNVGRVRQALVLSLPSVLTLLRGTLRLEENVAQLDKINAAERLSSRAGFEVSVLQRLQAVRYRRTTDNINDLAAHYMGLIDSVLNYLRK